MVLSVTGFEGSGGTAFETVTVNPVTAPSVNPAPVLGTLSPDGAKQATGSLTLTVGGTNFSSGAVVRWNGADLPTAVLSPSLLTAVVAAADPAPDTRRFRGDGTGLHSNARWR